MHGDKFGGGLLHGGFLRRPLGGPFGGKFRGRLRDLLLFAEETARTQGENRQHRNEQRNRSFKHIEYLLIGKLGCSINIP